MAKRKTRRIVRTGRGPTQEQRIAAGLQRAKQRAQERHRRRVRAQQGQATPEETAGVEAYHDLSQPGHRFKKGNPGRKPGSKEDLPRRAKASVREILETVVRTRQKTIKRAIIDGIKSGPKHADRYLKLAAEYVDGKPDSKLRMSFEENELETARRALMEKLDAVLGPIETAVADDEDAS